MPRSENQKFKILYVMRMLLERTDSSHIITMQEILAGLERHKISAERKVGLPDLEKVYGLYLSRKSRRDTVNI